MSYSVMIVDDEMLIREGLRHHIQWDRLDMEVCAVADCAETALNIAKQMPIDILITDICMRKKSGLELIEDLSELGITPQVILISSYNDFSYAQQAVRLQVVRDYILKPIDTDALEKSLHNIVRILKESTEKTNNSMHSYTDSYRLFLQQIHDNGYEHHLLMKEIRSGNTEEAEKIWDRARSVILAQNPSYTVDVVRRFTVGIALLISELSVSSQKKMLEDPVQKLQSNDNISDLCSIMTQQIRSECEQKKLETCAYSKLIASSLSIIDRKYCESNFNLMSLAAELGVTPNYLSMRFKAEVGVGFMNYLLDKQIEKAKSLLQSPHYKVYQISLMVGFQDEKFFSRQFKKIVGITPREYRNKCTDF